ncbi:MAG TPA: S41 family peptidase [Vicinamibacterales bacterium]
MRRILSSIVFTLALACPTIAFAQGPSSCTVASQNLWVRDALDEVYYWYQFMPPGVVPTKFNSPEAYLEAVRYRPIDNSYSFITSAAASDAFYSDSQFIGYGFGNQITENEIRVMQVYPDSPASEAGLLRGDRIFTVNGRSVSSMVADNTIGNAFGQAEVGVASTIEWETLSGERRSARLVKRLVTIPTVSLTSVVDLDGRKVGYLFFRNFVEPSKAALTEAFEALKAAGVTELVLDLRYNGGGLVDVAVHLASLIGGARTNAQVMLSYVHNDKLAAAYNKTTRFTNPPQALNLQRLVVITTRSSASASELVINSLRPFMPVTTIGDTTFGKPVGQYGLRFCDKILYPVAFSIRNANNQGDFFDGLAPDCTAGDDYNYQLGDSREASLAEALTFIRTGACSAKSAAAARALGAPRFVFKPSGWASILNAQ